MPDDFDGFLKIDGVTSESKDADHDEWIDIEGFSFGCEASDFTVGAEGKLEADDGSVNPFTFTGGMHKGSPTLFQLCVTGEPIPNVEFHARTSGGIPHTFFKAKLQDCIIQSVNWDTTGALPTETITIAYRAIEMTYVEQGQDGRPAMNGTVTINYDQAAHAEEEE